ncbi:MAG: hypothetical protein GF313_10780 [Caldithrix sp.]|nr:hypothetical protein [Caldithrix sp.]
MRFISLLMLLSFLLISISCKDQITSTCETEINVNTPQGPVTLAWIQDNVFDTHCVSCHGSNLTQADLNLADGQSYNNLVNIPATTSNLDRVKPGEPENSHLMERLTGEGAAIMPPAGPINQALIDSVASWIERGAPQN